MRLTAQEKARAVAGARTQERGARIRQALRGGALSDPIDLNGIAVRFCLLSQNTKDQAWLDTIADFQARGVELTSTTAELFMTAKLLRLLATAVLDAETGEPLASLEEWQQLGDTQTVQHAWEEYGRFEASTAPEEVVDLGAMIEEVRRYVGESGGGLMEHLKTLEYSTLVSLAASMVRRLVTSRTPSSSTGSSTDAS